MTTITDNQNMNDRGAIKITARVNRELDQAVAEVTAFPHWDALHHAILKYGYIPTLRTDDPDVGDRAHYNRCVTRIMHALDHCGYRHFPHGM